MKKRYPPKVNDPQDIDQIARAFAKDKKTGMRGDSSSYGGGAVLGQTPTLRDQFAMAALTALSAHIFDLPKEEAAEMAYQYADAMLKQREGR